MPYEPFTPAMQADVDRIAYIVQNVLVDEPNGRLVLLALLEILRQRVWLEMAARDSDGAVEN